MQYIFLIFWGLTNILFLHICSVDCKWTQWSNCSKSCGPENKTREIEVPAIHGGQNCIGKDTDSCNNKDCPGEPFPINYSQYIFLDFLALSNKMFHICSVDCKWSQWSRCSQTCGQGTKTRKIDVPANFGGQNCTGDDTDRCSDRECPGEPILNTIV